MRRITRVITAMLLVLVLGLHWSVVQSIAWTSMAIRYAQNSSLKEALSKTFDGKHPCRLCHLVEEGKQAEKEQERQAGMAPSKMEQGLLWEQAFLLFPPPSDRWFTLEMRAERRSDPPPSPPPRPRFDRLPA